MSDVQVFERAPASFAAGLAERGHHIVYRLNASNHCPGCGRSQWYIGRISAECGFCGTAVPLAEARHHQGATRSADSAPVRRTVADQRRHERKTAEGRTLQLLIDGSPRSFALHNISAGGVMGEGAPDLLPGASVFVRFEGGIVIPAIVKWADDGLVGLAFDTSVVVDRSTDAPN
jgi:hypothetical protein